MKCVNDPIRTNTVTSSEERSLTSPLTHIRLKTQIRGHAFAVSVAGMQRSRLILAKSSFQVQDWRFRIEVMFIVLCVITK